MFIYPEKNKFPELKMKKNKIKDQPVNNKKNKKVIIKSKRNVFFSIIVLSAFLAELYGYAWCRVQCVKIGYSIAEATQKKEQLYALQESLSIELERLKSPNRIIQIAKNQIGLNMPEQRQIVQIP